MEVKFHNVSLFINPLSCSVILIHRYHKPSLRETIEREGLKSYAQLTEEGKKNHDLGF